MTTGGFTGMGASTINHYQNVFGQLNAAAGANYAPVQNLQPIQGQIQQYQQPFAPVYATPVYQNAVQQMNYVPNVVQPVMGMPNLVQLPSYVPNIVQTPAFIPTMPLPMNFVASVVPPPSVVANVDDPFTRNGREFIRGLFARD